MTAKTAMLQQQQQHASPLNMHQLNNLRYQTQALKHLQANEPVPTHLQNLVLAGSTPSQPQDQPSVAQKVVDATFKLDKAIKSTSAAAVVGKTPNATHADQHQRILMPAILPSLVDPNALRDDRAAFIKARVQYRIKELEETDSSLHPDEKIKALIELKSLKLMDKQMQLRADILQSISKSSTLATALDRSTFKRLKKQSLREGINCADNSFHKLARQTEKQERALRGEKDKKERQKHLDYVGSILAHARDFMAFHRTTAVIPPP